jgi:hypothetical protein
MLSNNDKITALTARPDAPLFQTEYYHALLNLSEGQLDRLYQETINGTQLNQPTTGSFDSRQSARFPRFYPQKKAT